MWLYLNLNLIQVFTGRVYDIQRQGWGKNTKQNKNCREEKLEVAKKHSKKRKP